MSKDLSAKYYRDNKETLQKGQRKISKSFWIRKIKKNQQYGCEQYKNLPKDEKTKSS